MGYAAAVCCTPLPASATVAGELEALLKTVTLPATLPDTDGVKLTFRVALCPGVRIVPAGTPLALNPAPEMPMLEIETLELPVLFRVTGSVLLASVLTFPKLRLVGLALRAVVAAFTVSVAVLLVALPAELLTTTLNCAALSVLVVAGVV
jgi:hypothetical protein